MLGGSPESTSPHAPMLSSAIPIVITRSAIVSPRCNGFRERAAAALDGPPLPRLDVIHEVVVSDRGGCAGRHANVGGADHGEDHDAGGRESHDERSLGRWYPVQNYTTRWRCSVTSTRHTECSRLDQHVAGTRRRIVGMPRWRSGRRAARLSKHWSRRRFCASWPALPLQPFRL